eukprot:NODE_594_length_6300_cov_0.153201.p5 type:complete len:133 gc:universal NODE_594_length_6300_cov_0.153201:1409-1807(+)
MNRIKTTCLISQLQSSISVGGVFLIKLDRTMVLDSSFTNMIDKHSSKYSLASCGLLATVSLALFTSATTVASIESKDLYSKSEVENLEEIDFENLLIRFGVVDMFENKTAPCFSNYLCKPHETLTCTQIISS